MLYLFTSIALFLAVIATIALIGVFNVLFVLMVVAAALGVCVLYRMMNP